MERLGWGRAPEWGHRRRTEQPGVSRRLQLKYMVPTGWEQLPPALRHQGHRRR